MTPHPLRLVARCIMLLALMSVTLAQTPADWSDPFEMSFDPVEPVSITPERVAFDNGLVVYLFEDRSLPFVDGIAYVRAPTLYDPEGKVGLASLTANLLRTGGAGGRSADELDEALEFAAASVEASANSTFLAVSFSTLSDTLDDVLEIFRDVMLEPDFAPNRIDIARRQTLEALRRQNDQPVQIAQREFIRRLWQGHPAGNAPSVESVNAVSRDDMVAFHARYLAPNATIMALSGDFDSAEMVGRLEATFGGWQRHEVDYPELPEVNPSPEPRIYHAQRDIAQSIVFVGHPSVYAYSPEYNALDVANGILGGEGFSSRVVSEIRTRRGLAYATASILAQGFEYPGVPGFFYAYSISRSDATGEVITALKDEIRRLQEGGVSEAELEQQKDTVLSRAVFRFTDAAAVTQRSARAEFLGLETDYYDRYIEQLQTLTPQDIQQVAQQQLHPDGLVIMVVGNAATFSEPLETLGEVEEVRLE